MTDRHAGAKVPCAMTKVNRRDWALSPSQRIDAREAITMLDGTMTLTDAARIAMAGRKATRRISFADAVGEFKRELLSRDNDQPGGRAATLSWYETKLSRPLDEFGEKHFDELTRAEIKKMLDAQKGWSSGTKAAVTRALRAVYRWGMKIDNPIAVADPTEGLAVKSTGNRGDAEFFTVDQVEKIMTSAGRYRNALALMLFAGIRPEEIAGRNKDRLLWKHIDVVGKTIRIPGDISKTGKPRVNEGFPETVWAWLHPGKPNDPISVGLIRQATDHAKKTLGLDEFPHDATRHTFSTYALALSGDPGKVSHWTGHEGKPSLLHQTYRGLATNADGVRFFGLRPAA